MAIKSLFLGGIFGWIIVLNDTEIAVRSYITTVMERFDLVCSSRRVPDKSIIT